MSPVACKAIVGQMPSSLLAGLLYLGSGLGLTGDLDSIPFDIDNTYQNVDVATSNVCADCHSGRNKSRSRCT